MQIGRKSSRKELEEGVFKSDKRTKMHKKGAHTDDNDHNDSSYIRYYSRYL